MGQEERQVVCLSGRLVGMLQMCVQLISDIASIAHGGKRYAVKELWHLLMTFLF